MGKSWISRSSPSIGMQIAAFALAAGFAASSRGEPVPSTILSGASYAYCMAGDAERNTIYMFPVFAVMLPATPSVESGFKAFLRSHYPAPGLTTPKTWVEPACFADHDQTAVAEHRALRLEDDKGYGVSVIETDWKP